MCSCSATSWNYLQCSLASRLRPHRGHSHSPTWAVGREGSWAGGAWRTAGAVPARRAKRQWVPRYDFHPPEKEGDLIPPPVLSVLSMSKGSPQQPQEESAAGWDGKREHGLVSVENGALQPRTCTLAPPHTHPLLPAAVHNAFSVSSVLSVQGLE